MKVLITGVSGFVGANLARFLLKKNLEVHGTIRPNSSSLWRIEDIKNKIKLHVCDLTDKETVFRLMQEIKPKAVFHLAVYGAYPTQKDYEKILGTSIPSTLHLLQASKESGVEKFVNIGSSSEYGTKNHPMVESEILEPNSIYAVAKSAQTHLCDYYSQKEGLPTVTMRLFSVYGPFEEPGRLFPTNILNCLNNIDMPLSDPKIARDFIYVDDVCNALYLASKNKKVSGIFNLGSGKQRTLKNVFDEVKKQTKSKSRAIIGGYEQRSFDTNIWVANMKKTNKLLSFKPKYNFSEGIKKTVEWFRKNKKLYDKKND